MSLSECKCQDLGSDRKKKRKERKAGANLKPACQYEAMQSFSMEFCSIPFKGIVCTIGGNIHFKFSLPSPPGPDRPNSCKAMMSEQYFPFSFSRSQQYSLPQSPSGKCCHTETPIHTCTVLIRRPWFDTHLRLTRLSLSDPPCHKECPMVLLGSAKASLWPLLIPIIACHGQQSFWWTTVDYSTVGLV